FILIFIMSGISFLLLLFTDGRLGNIYLILQIIFSLIIIVFNVVKTNISNIILLFTAVSYEMIYYFLIGNNNIYDFFNPEGTGHYYSIYSIECFLVSIITTVILIAFNFSIKSKGNFKNIKNI
ncbi:MAG: hypothetical protein K2G63_03475, partial [Oscillospiraceae bacterium]|nr:hypothetical protein [Oscillospiraceae bacterium]